MVNGGSEWLRDQVNFAQTPEERRDKYEYLRTCGCKPASARRARDFSWSHVLIWAEHAYLEQTAKEENNDHRRSFRKTA
jgi:hypothetical protein